MPPVKGETSLQHHFEQERQENQQLTKGNSSELDGLRHELHEAVRDRDTANVEMFNRALWRKRMKRDDAIRMILEAGANGCKPIGRQTNYVDVNAILGREDPNGVLTYNSRNFTPRCRSSGSRTAIGNKPSYSFTCTRGTRRKEEFCHRERHSNYVRSKNCLQILLSRSTNGDLHGWRMQGNNVAGNLLARWVRLCSHVGMAWRVNP